MSAPEDLANCCALRVLRPGAGLSKDYQDMSDDFKKDEENFFNKTIDVNIGIYYNYNL